MKYLVSYQPHRQGDVKRELRKYGRIVYESPIINVYAIDTVHDKETLKEISGVTRVYKGFSGRLDIQKGD